MKVQFIQFIIVIVMIFELIETYPQKRASGFDRMRDRQHRKRHHQQESAIVNQTDDLYELSVGNESKIFRFEKSIDLVTEKPLSQKHKHKKHGHHLRKNSRREKNEELCKSERKSRELNTEGHEFNPPFIFEVRCLSNKQGFFGFGKSEQTCVKGMLRCVQQYTDIHVSRRSVGSIHWHPHTIQNVPISCQCMWPVDKYGQQEL